MKGQKTGGRTAGTPNTFTKSVKEAFKDAFDEMQKDPKVNLLEWGKKNPGYFYPLAAKLMPAAVELKADVEGVEQIFKIGNVEIKL
jgi:hypothetical protein